MLDPSQLKTASSINSTNSNFNTTEVTKQNSTNTDSGTTVTVSLLQKDAVIGLSASVSDDILDLDLQEPDLSVEAIKRQELANMLKQNRVAASLEKIFMRDITQSDIDVANLDDLIGLLKFKYAEQKVDNEETKKNVLNNSKLMLSARQKDIADSIAKYDEQLREISSATTLIKDRVAILNTQITEEEANQVELSQKLSNGEITQTEYDEQVLTSNTLILLYQTQKSSLQDSLDLVNLWFGDLFKILAAVAEGLTDTEKLQKVLDLESVKILQALLEQIQEFLLKSKEAFIEESQETNQAQQVIQESKISTDTVTEQKLDKVQIEQSSLSNLDIKKLDADLEPYYNPVKLAAALIKEDKLEQHFNLTGVNKLTSPLNEDILFRRAARIAKIVETISMVDQSVQNNFQKEALNDLLKEALVNKKMANLENHNIALNLGREILQHLLALNSILEQKDSIDDVTNKADMNKINQNTLAIDNISEQLAATLQSAELDIEQNNNFLLNSLPKDQLDVKPALPIEDQEVIEVDDSDIKKLDLLAEKEDLMDDEYFNHLVKEEHVKELLLESWISKQTALSLANRDAFYEENRRRLDDTLSDLTTHKV